MVHFTHFLNGQNTSSRRRRKRTDTCRRTLHEKQASETARLRETGRERCAGLSVFRHQTPERIDKFKYEGKLHHRLGLLFCRPVALRGHA